MVQGHPEVRMTMIFHDAIETRARCAGACVACYPCSATLTSSLLPLWYPYYKLCSNLSARPTNARPEGILSPRPHSPTKHLQSSKHKHFEPRAANSKARGLNDKPWNRPFFTPTSLKVYRGWAVPPCCKECFCLCSWGSFMRELLYMCS